MIKASEIKIGTVLHQGGDFLKVVSIDFAGAAKNERSLKMKLKNLMMNHEWKNWIGLRTRRAKF